MKRGIITLILIAMLFVAFAVLFFVSPLAAAEQRYEVDLTDYGAVHAIVKLANGEALADAVSKLSEQFPMLASGSSISPEQVMAIIKSRDIETMTRARPAWRRDGHMDRKAKGFYWVKVYLWRGYEPGMALGPLSALNYEVEFYGDKGSETRVHSRVYLDVRRFGRGDGLKVLANVPLIHRFVNRKGEQLVMVAERGLLDGIALVEKMRRDYERRLRRHLE